MPPNSGPSVDILGVGFGPANLSLAIAIEEYNAGRPAGQRLTARFVESQPEFGWHDGMLLPRTTMQISFLKDLVCLRSPTSPFTFVNYLHQQGRLSDFVNLKSFFPTRQEFRDYLCWAAERISLPVDYGVSATGIDQRDGRFDVAVATGDGVGRLSARHIALGLGISPTLPSGVTPGPRVFHNHGLLHRLAELPTRSNRRFLVVGSGQSGAEVVAYLHDSYPDARIHASFRRFGYTPSDDTPFANRIFDATSVDEFYAAPPDVKGQLMDYHWLTNYSAVDADLINELYRREYDESVRNQRRLMVHRMTEIQQLHEYADGVEVTLQNLGSGEATDLRVDAVVLATGFRPRDVRALLGPTIDPTPAFTAEGLPRVERDYGLRLPGAPGRIFLNGGVEHSHGLTSSLLSNLAIRAADILRAVTRAPVTGRPAEPSTTGG